MTGTELTDGVILDEDSGTAYVMDALGGISAIDLKEGVQIWHSERALRPLVLSDEFLVVQAQNPKRRNVLQLATLEVSNAGALVNESQVELPENVRPGLTRSTTQSFAVNARADDGSVIVDWEYREGRGSGIPDDPEEVLLDEISTGDDPFDFEMEIPISPAVSGVANVMRGQARISLSDGSVQAAARSGTDFEALSIPQTSSSAVPRPEPREPLEQPGVFYSRDFKNYIKSTLIEEHAWDEFRWVVFDTKTDKQLGAINSSEDFAPFIVSRNTLLVEFQPLWTAEAGEVTDLPRRLSAIDLETGRVVWEYPLGDPLVAPAPPP